MSSGEAINRAACGSTIVPRGYRAFGIGIYIVPPGRSAAAFAETDYPETGLARQDRCGEVSKPDSTSTGIR